MNYTGLIELLLYSLSLILFIVIGIIHTGKSSREKLDTVFLKEYVISCITTVGIAYLICTILCEVFSK